MIKPDAELLPSKDTPWKEYVGFKLLISFPLLSSILELSLTTSPVLTELLLAEMSNEITGLSFTFIFLDAFTPSTSTVIVASPFFKAFKSPFESTFTTFLFDEVILPIKSFLSFPLAVTDLYVIGM